MPTDELELELILSQMAQKPMLRGDEDDQDGHFFYNHPERGAYSAA